MKFAPGDIDGLFLVTPHAYRDARGGVSKAYEGAEFAAHGLATAWKQHFISITDRARTVRGLHFQRAPFAEAKLLQGVSGASFWVAVDLRDGSPTRLQWSGTVLEPGGPCLYAARGFAHGSVSLADDTRLVVMADAEFSPDHGVGIAWDDPDLAIDWPIPEGHAPLLSEEHAAYPPLRALNL